MGLTIRESFAVSEILIQAVWNINKVTKGEPLNGDEVAEVSAIFVKELCVSNGEDDQIKQILKGSL